MADDKPKKTIRKVRTFADDVQRAMGTASKKVIEQTAPQAPASLPQTALAKEINAAMVKEVAAVPPPSPSPLTGRAPAFDIRKEATEGAGEATIINDRRAKESVLVSAFKESATAWWKTINAVPEPRGSRPGNKRGSKGISQPSEFSKAIINFWNYINGNSSPEEVTILGEGVAPRAVIVPEVLPPVHVATPATSPTDINKLPDNQQKIVAPKMRTLARDVEQAAEVHARQVALHAEAARPKWNAISEPREGGPLASTMSADIQSFKADLKRSLPAPMSAKPSIIREARKTRAPQGFTTVVRGDLFSKDGTPSVAPRAAYNDLESARARLAALSEQTTRQAAEPIPEEPGEKAPSRDIPFISPIYKEEESAAIRTYRYDALHDVKEKTLSAPQIAAEEYERRGTTHVPIPVPVRRTHTHLVPILVGCLALLVLGVGGTIAYPYLANPRSDQQEIVPVTAFFTPHSVRPLALPKDRLGFLAGLDMARRATPLPPQTSVQFNPTVSENGIERTARIDEIMDIFDPRVPAAFVRALESTIMFGSYGAEQTPFIVMRAAPYDITFAGMLAWEGSMSIDLSPFFGEPVRRSYDPDSLTVDKARAAHFTDTIVRNIDARILYDETGAERIIYSFIDPRTIVITSSSEALLGLMEELR